MSETPKKKSQQDHWYEGARYYKLCLELTWHNLWYHHHDNPLISDTEYDRRYREIELFELDNPDWVHPDSPTQYVGNPALRKKR